MAITTEIAKFRLELGDDDALLFTDDQVNYFLAAHPSVLLAVAAACDALATRFAKQVDIAEDGQSFKLSQKSATYMALAKRFRERAAVEDDDPDDGVIPGEPLGRVPARRPTTWAERF